MGMRWARATNTSNTSNTDNSSSCIGRKAGREYHLPVNIYVVLYDYFDMITKLVLQIGNCSNCVLSFSLFILTFSLFRSFKCAITNSDERLSIITLRFHR